MALPRLRSPLRSLVQQVAPRRAPQLSAGERAIRQQYGTILGEINPETGRRPVISQQAAMNAMFSTPTLPSGAPNPNYRPPGGYGNTPFMNSQGQRMGFWNDVTQNFDILGGGRPGQIGGGGGGISGPGGPVGGMRGGPPGDWGGPPGAGPAAPNASAQALAALQGAAPQAASNSAVTGGLPLSGAQEAGQRALENQLASSLAQIGVAWDQIPAVLNLITSRLGTQQAQASDQLDEQLIGRGLYRSGIRGQEMQRLKAAYDRQREDAGLNAAQQYQALAGQKAGAYGDYQQQMMDLLLQLAGGYAQNPTMAMPGALGAELGQGIPSVGAGARGGRGRPRRTTAGQLNAGPGARNLGRPLHFQSASTTTRRQSSRRTRARRRY